MKKDTYEHNTRLQEITRAQFCKRYVKKEVSLCLATPPKLMANQTYIPSYWGFTFKAWAYDCRNKCHHQCSNMLSSKLRAGLKRKSLTRF